MIVKIGVENSNDALGCRKAPDAVLKYFDNLIMSESGKELIKENIDIKEINVRESDFNLIDDRLHKAAFDFISNNDKVIFLGGDHSLSYSTVGAFSDFCNSQDLPMKLIVFDAHTDCKSSDKDIPNNLQWLKKLIEDGFPRDSIILVGLRSFSKDEIYFLGESSSLQDRIRIYSMKDIHDFEEVCDLIMEQSNKSQVYLSIDIDVVDSVFVPGTARPESGGMTSRQLIYFIQRLNLLKGIKVIDITEINPDKDINDVTVQLGAKILGEII